MNRKETNHNQHQLTYDVYVGNVPKNINQADLNNLFKAFGEVKQVICRWKEDYFGFGIVKFALRHDAERVLREYPEVILNGHTMPVKPARRSDQSHNGHIPVENKSSSYVEMNKNKIHNGAPFSNTDYGYFHPPKYPEEPLIKPPSQPMMLEVLCTSVENAITFYGCPVNRSEELSIVINTLRTLPPTMHNRHERKPFMNKMYVALYSGDSAWYRCQVICPVLPKKQGMCSVRYIDYGNQEDVSYRHVLEVPEPLEKIPALATKFVLSNLVCENKLAGKTYLHQLVNKRMSLSAFLSSSNFEYRVVKCSCNGKDVIAETISKNYAKPLKTMKHNGHLEQPLRSKAFAHGSEVLLKPNVFNNSNSFPKVPDNNITYSIKSRPKIEEATFKKEVVCNGSADESKREQEFHPKMIIKRGSELSDLSATINTVPKVAKEDPKPQLPQANLLDSVISNLKLINNVRGLVSKSSDDSIIMSAVSLIEELSTLEEVEKSMKLVDGALKEFYGDLEKIKLCSDQTQLLELKTKRDASRENLCKVLSDYLSGCDNSIFERKDKIQSAITDLESNSNAWMNVNLEKKPCGITEVISEYNKVKEKRWNLVSKTRENTNQKHKIFMKIFGEMQKELYLNVLEENDLSNSEPEVSGISKPTMYSEKWNESLRELAKYLEEEIHTLTVKDSSGISIIQCLLAMLDEHKEKIELVCEAYENHFALHNKLSKLPDIEALSSELSRVKEEIKDISLEISKREKSGEEDEAKAAQYISLIKNLHAILLTEDYLKVSLCNAAEELYPELFLYYTELLRCSKTKSLLKSWKREYFLVQSVGTRGESSFSSELLDDVIDIKEYRFESMEEVNGFVQKASTWDKIRSDSLVKIKALFVKEEEKTVCVLLPPVLNTLQSNSLSPGAGEGEKACHVLRQVLIGLRDLHSSGIIHRSIHPTTILIEGEKALLDFCFDQKYLNGKAYLKSINFQPPESEAMHESADMYAFGCLVLWVLFPNLSFTTSGNGVPNIAAFRSIIEELILPKDYALLSALLDVNPAKRPLASILLHKGFLSKYEGFCKSRSDSQKKLPS